MQRKNLIFLTMMVVMVSACSDFNSNPSLATVTSQVLVNSGQLLDINTGVGQDVSSGWIQLGSALYFIDRPTTNFGHQIWKSTSAGSASLLIDLGAQNFVAGLLVDNRTTSAPTRFYFVVNGTDLWTSDGAHTSRIAQYLDNGGIVTTSVIGNDIYYQVNGTGGNGQVFKSVNGGTPGEIFTTGTTSFSAAVFFIPAAVNMYIYDQAAPVTVFAHEGAASAAATVVALTAPNTVTLPIVMSDDLYYQESATFKVFKSAGGNPGGEVLDDLGGHIAAAATLIPATTRMYFFLNAANNKIWTHTGAAGDAVLVDTTPAANTVAMAKTVGKDLYYQYSAAFNVEKSVDGATALEVLDNTSASFGATAAMTTVAGATKMYIFQTAANVKVFSHSGASAPCALVGSLTAPNTVTNPTLVTDDLYFQESVTNKVFKSVAGGAASLGEITDNLGNSIANPVAFVPGSTSDMYFHGNAVAGNATVYSHTGNPGVATLVMNGAVGLFNSGKMLTVGNNLFFQGPTAGSPVGLFDSIAGAEGIDVGSYSPSANDDYLCTVPYKPVAVGASLFFVANDGTHGCELWTTAGTPASTYMVKDVNAGQIGSDPTSLAAVGTRVYFVAKDSSVVASPANTYLFFSDSPYTTASKVTLTGADANPSPVYLTAVGSKLYFGAMVGGIITLFEHDATGSAAAGIKQTSVIPANLILNAGPTPFILAVGTKAYIRAAPLGTSVYDVYLSDSTLTLAENPALIKHLNSSAVTSSNPTLFKNGYYATTVFFSADDGTGVELWKTDGTSAGTVKIRNLNGNPTANASGSPSQLTWAGTNLYFTASDNMPGDGGPELYVSALPWTDATKLTFRSTVPQITNLVPLGDFLIFTMSEDGTAPNSGVYRTDGTVANTIRLRAADALGGISGPTFNTIGNGYANGKQFFTFVFNPLVGSQLFATDGSVDGTGLVKGLNPSPFTSPIDEVAASDVINFSVVGGNLIFPGNDGTTGTQLWYSDGTAAGTGLINDYTPLDNNGSAPVLLGTAGSAAYYVLRDTTHGRTIYKISPL